MSDRSEQIVKRVGAVAGAFILAAMALGILVMIGVAVAGFFVDRSDRVALRKAEPAVPAAPELRLAEFTPVIGTSRFRARLVKDEENRKWASYGGAGPARNLLFADSDTGNARWLLPDDDHEIVVLNDLPEGWHVDKPPPVVTVALVKPHAEQMDLATGKLFVLTPAGDRVVEIGNDVRDVSAMTLIGESRLSLVYERRRKFIVAQFDLQQFVLLHQKELALPPLR